MIIDIHGHYTTYPPGVEAYRGAQIAQMSAPTKGFLGVGIEKAWCSRRRDLAEMAFAASRMKIRSAL